MSSSPAGQEPARRRRVLLALLLAVAVVTGCGDSSTAPMDEPPPPPPDEPPAALGWQTLSGSPDAEEGRFEDVYFLTPDVGWIVSLRGEVYGTEDGGTSWTLLFQAPDIPFRAAGFATSDLGWAGNINALDSPDPDTALYETRDGGRTWSNITDRISGPEPVGICGIWVEDEETVYAAGRWAGPAIFLRTEDGGRTWRALTVADSTAFSGIGFASEELGWVAGSTVFQTEDGGESWNEVTLGQSINRFRFLGPDLGFASRRRVYVFR